MEKRRAHAGAASGFGNVRLALALSIFQYLRHPIKPGVHRKIAELEATVARLHAEKLSFVVI